MSNTLTPAEQSALDAFNSSKFTPPVPHIDVELTALGIDPAGYHESLNAEHTFVDYIAAVAIQDLHRLHALYRGPEVVAVAQQFWPLTSDDA